MDRHTAPVAEISQGPRVPGEFAILRRRSERGEKRGYWLQPGSRFLHEQVTCQQRV
jgi:hypothetical protein